MKSVLGPQGFNFVELIPDTKDPNWFKAQCRAGVHCDILVVSGHFGGLFFGEKLSSTLKLAELEEASCNASCPGVISAPKEVFLFGCNTLATKQRDHRTLNQYLDVLVGDGLPMDFAEQVAASRYSGLGFTLESRFAGVFRNTPKIYGFSSTGPLGAAAAPRLRSYFARVGDYNQHLAQISNSSPNKNLAKSFSGTSFRETNPQRALSESDRQLYCSLAGSEGAARTDAFTQVVSENRSGTFFDTLTSRFTKFGDQFWPSIDLEGFERTLSKFKAQTQGLVTLQAKIIRLQESMNFIDQNQKHVALKSLIQKLWVGSLSYPKVTQTCAIASNEMVLDWMSQDQAKDFMKKSPLSLLALSCFSGLSSQVLNAVQEQRTRPTSRAHAELSLFTLSKFLRQPTLLRESVPTGSALGYCLGGLSPYYEGTQAWACLEQNQAELTVGACESVARTNPDAENSDDMRWYCWDRLRTRKDFTKAQCFQLASTMRILGNQMKAVWNCTHDL